MFRGETVASLRRPTDTSRHVHNRSAHEDGKVQEFASGDEGPRKHWEELVGASTGLTRPKVPAVGRAARSATVVRSQLADSVAAAFQLVFRKCFLVLFPNIALGRLASVSISAVRASVKDAP